MICLITHVSKAYIAVAIDRCRTRFAEHEFRFAGKGVTATASFGAIGFEGDEAPSFARLLLDAEAALNAAKKAGGNQYHVATTAKTKSGA